MIKTKSISWTMAILVACILIYSYIGLAQPHINQQEIKYRCYYIRQDSQLCLGGGQIRENVTFQECESLRIEGERNANECNSNFEWSIK